jgi:hypothetical protein
MNRPTGSAVKRSWYLRALQLAGSADPAVNAVINAAQTAVAVFSRIPPLRLVRARKASEQTTKQARRPVRWRAQRILREAHR